MKRLLALILITVLATACQPVTPEAAASSAPALDTAPRAAATSEPAPAPTSEASALALGEGVLATDWHDDENWLVVLDPVTGQRLSAAEPIRLGANYFSARTPDGDTLAIVALEGIHTILHLIDLNTWTDVKTGLDIPREQYLNAVRYSPDGRTLIVVTPGAPNGLFIVDVATRTVTASAQLHFNVRAVQFTRDSLGLMLYGVPVKPYSEVTAGDPRVILLSAADLSEQWHVDLLGMQDGIYPKAEAQDDLHAPGAALHYMPGLSFAPDRDALYIVPGHADQLLTVDFTARQLSAVQIAKKVSLFEQLLALTASVAHAKIMDGTLKQAAISADGQTLYVVGMTNTFNKQSNGQYKLEQTPLDLQAIRTADGTLLAHVPSKATALTLAPDGSALYLVGNFYTASYAPFTAIVDPLTLATRQTFDGFEIQPGRRLNGSRILLAVKYGASENSMELASFEADSLQPIGAWHVDHYMGWVTR